MTALKRVQDPKTGLWFQVVDKGNQEGNWNDTSGSAMFLYGIKKAGELGVINPDDFDEVVDNAYKGIRSKAVVNPEDGLLDIINVCDGMCVMASYEDYINRPQKVNAKEAVGSVLWGSWIVEKPSSVDTADTTKSSKKTP